MNEREWLLRKKFGDGREQNYTCWTEKTALRRFRHLAKAIAENRLPGLVKVLLFDPDEQLHSEFSVGDILPEDVFVPSDERQFPWIVRVEYIDNSTLDLGFFDQESADYKAESMGRQDRVHSVLVYGPDEALPVPVAPGMHHAATEDQQRLLDQLVESANSDTHAEEPFFPPVDVPEESKAQLDLGMDTLDRLGPIPDREAARDQAQLHFLASIAISLYELNQVAKNLHEVGLPLLEQLSHPEQASEPDMASLKATMGKLREDVRRVIQERREEDQARVARMKAEGIPQDELHVGKVMAECTCPESSGPNRAADIVDCPVHGVGLLKRRSQDD